MSNIGVPEEQENKQSGIDTVPLNLNLSIIANAWNEPGPNDNFDKWKSPNNQQSLSDREKLKITASHGLSNILASKNGHNTLYIQEVSKVFSGDGAPHATTLRLKCDPHIDRFSVAEREEVIAAGFKATKGFGTPWVLDNPAVLLNPKRLQEAIVLRWGYIPHILGFVSVNDWNMAYTFLFENLSVYRELREDESSMSVIIGDIQNLMNVYLAQVHGNYRPSVLEAEKSSFPYLDKGGRLFVSCAALRKMAKDYGVLDKTAKQGGAITFDSQVGEYLRYIGESPVPFPKPIEEGSEGVSPNTKEPIEIEMWDITSLLELHKPAAIAEGGNASININADNITETLGDGDDHLELEVEIEEDEGEADEEPI